MDFDLPASKQRVGGSNPSGRAIHAMFIVYRLRSVTTGRFYTGLTSDLPRRLREHNSDTSTSTKHRSPSELVRQEQFGALSEAARRERFLKTGHGREEIRRILAHRTHPQLSRIDSPGRTSSRGSGVLRLGGPEFRAVCVPTTLVGGRAIPLSVLFFPQSASL